jgi:hypothetical protein
MLALFWRVGGFFLMMSILSIMVHVPTLNFKMRSYFLGIDEADSREQYLSNPTGAAMSKVLGTIIILTWLSLAVVSFAKIDTPLIEVIRDWQN